MAVGCVNAVVLWLVGIIKKFWALTFFVDVAKNYKHGALRCIAQGYR
jgi:hypothetical protein